MSRPQRMMWTHFSPPAVLQMQKKKKKGYTFWWTVETDVPTMTLKHFSDRESAKVVENITFLLFCVAKTEKYYLYWWGTSCLRKRKRHFLTILTTILTWFMDIKTEVSQVINSISFYFMNSWLYIITSSFAVKIFILNIHKDSDTNQSIFSP